MKTLHMIAFILLIIGGLNWLLIGLNVGWDISYVLGDKLSQVVYVLVGAAAVVELVGHKKSCKYCG